MKLRVLDLFSGIGGFSLGLERTGGFEAVAFCEIDPFCRAVLRKHWPNVRQYEDVREVKFGEGGTDVVTAGFPCQDISLANAVWGGRAGVAGARSGLYRHVVRAIRMVRPRFTILENVAALLGRGMGTVLGDLAEIGQDAEWHCIPMRAVGGSQERDRIFIVAYPGGERGEGLLSGAHIGAARQGRESGQTDLQQVVASPFERGNCHPQPLLRGMARRVPGRVDRVKACGNSIDPHIAQMIGHAILESMKEPA